jgi:hypothetical protein
LFGVIARRNTVRVKKNKENRRPVLKCLQKHGMMQWSAGADFVTGRQTIAMNGSRLALSGLIAITLGAAACNESRRESTREEHTTTTMPAPADSSSTVTLSAPVKADTAGAKMHSYPLDAGANDWILVPGESAGVTLINSDLDEVIKRLGRPDSGDAAMQKSVSVWYGNHDPGEHSVVIYATRSPGNDEVARVKQIRVNAPKFEAVSGVGVGTNEKDIRSRYKVREVETYTGLDGKKSKVLDSEDGIAFEIGADGICDAVVIHAPGKDQYGSYLKLRY